MRTRSMVRPFQILIAAAALVLAGAFGALLASGAAPARPLTASADGGAGTTAAASPATIDASGSTVDAIIAAALSEPADAGSANLAAPSTGPRVGAARGAGILRSIVGRTDRAEITVTTAAGQQTILYVKGTIATVSATGITITMRDGTSQAYAIDTTTRVRSQGKDIAISSLSTGETALVLGLKSGDGYTARFVRALPRAGGTTGG